MNFRLLGLLAIAALLSSASFAATPPNILLIVADDLGCMDIGANHPATFYETPHIDSLARRGMRFTAGYAACPVCSPTRAALLTGKYPPRTGITDFIPGSPNGKLLRAPNADRLAADEVTLAERLRDAGYATFFAGKWHLGGKDAGPGTQGFPADLEVIMDGRKPSNFWFPKSATPAAASEDDPKLSERIADDAVRFIQSHTQRPFFACLPFLAPHTPVKAPAALVAKYERKRQTAPPDAWRKERGNDTRLVQNHAAYAAMIEQMDSAIGRVLAAVKTAGLDERTHIIFTSDNGGLSIASARPTANEPARAGKGWAYEGGLRVPWIIVAPGITPPGSTNATPILSTDLVPTVLALTGQPQNPAPHSDGVNLVPLLQGGSIGARPLFWHYPHYGAQHGAPFGAIRDGEWKLIEWYEDHRLELFHLAEDPGEKHNLAATHPEKAATLLQTLQTWRTSVNAPMPTPNPDWPASARSPRPSRKQP